MFVNDILKVFYAPHKVFKDIVQNPKYIGPLLILVVFVAAQTGFLYVRASKINLEQTKPSGLLADEWTENATRWQASSGVIITNNFADFINATSPFLGSPDYYGNSSVQFTLDNGSNVQMALADLDGSVNCGVDGFENLTLRVKLVSPEAEPENVTLYLYSLGDANYFSYDLTPLFSTSVVDVWNNITVPVGSGDWSSSNTAAKWENITSLRMYFGWSTNSSIRILVDGLFFKGLFKSSIEVSGGQTVLLNIALSAATPFLFQWLLLTALMYVLIKGLKGTALWKSLMVAVGFALVILVVQALIMLATYSTLSNVNVPLEYFAGVPGEFNVANEAIIKALEQVSLIGGVIQVAVYVWTIALGAFIVRAVTTPVAVPAAEALPGVRQQFGWLKCLLVSGASFLLTLIVLGFIGI